MSSTGVERRYASNRGPWQKSMCIASITRTQGRRTMKRVYKLTLGTLGVLVLGVVLSAGEVCAQTAKDLAGSWTLVSVVTERDGHKTDSFGPNPKGILMVD